MDETRTRPGRQRKRDADRVPFLKNTEVGPGAKAASLNTFPKVSDSKNSPSGNGSQRRRRPPRKKKSAGAPKAASNSGGEGGEKRPQKKKSAGNRQGGNRSSKKRPRRNNTSAGQRPPRRRSKPAPKQSLLRRLLVFLGLADPKRAPRRKSNTAMAAEADERRQAKAAGIPKDAPQHSLTSPRIYITNLPFEVTEEDLEDLFGGAGHVAHCEIIADPETQRSNGEAYVDMYTRTEATRAIDTIHDRAFMGRRLNVTGAPPEADAPPEPADTVPERKPQKDIVLQGKRGE